MAVAKNKVQAGRLLKEEPGFQLYEILTEDGYGLGGFGMTVAAFNAYGVAVRVSRGTGYESDEMQASSQVVLSRDDLEKLMASYRAFERAQKKAASALASTPASDDFDPFLDSDDLP